MRACFERMHIVEATHALTSDARPVAALRRGKGSSLWLALEQVSRGSANACVSAGSTAAILALGVKLLGMLAGDRTTGIDVPCTFGLWSYQLAGSGC